MRLRSLKSKLLVTVSALVIGSSLMISLLVTHRYSNRVFESMAAQAESLANAISMDATDKILIHDLVALQKMLDVQINSNPVIAYLFILRDGNLLAHTFMKGIPKDLIRANTPLTVDKANLKTVASTEGESFLDLALPIFSGKAGILRLGVSKTPYIQEVRRLWLQMSFITLGILLVALTISLLFIRRVTRPFSTLAKAAEKIDQGHLTLDVELKESGDELGMLNASFNRMIRRIMEYTRRLEEKNLELDRAHHQTRTSFVISNEINALSSLQGVCDYLLRKLQMIVTCKEMVVLTMNQNNTSFLVHPEGKETVLSANYLRKWLTFLKQLDGLSYTKKEQVPIEIFPNSFKHCEKMVVFPFQHDGQFQGAMFIACPGDCNCVTKELDVIEMILTQSSGAIRRAIFHEEELRELKTRIESTSEYRGLIGKDPKMQGIYKLIEDVAPTDATVLIQGESGTGKELIARAIQVQSMRKGSPFVVINCSAYPASLLESELFGHEKGAFTGAIRQKIGRFEQADGGTVFLDEIGEISATAQIKLLRVLQTQKFERVGGEETVSVNVRILAATNKDLIKEIKNGRFREDLFYRLNVIPIYAPALRKRRNDIPLLTNHFLSKMATEPEKGLQDISSEVMRALLDYSWPGNVRELENSIEHAMVLAKGIRIEMSHLPTAMTHSLLDRTLDRPYATMGENEKKFLIDTLTECGWNKKMAAKRIGISRSTLYNKLRKYQIAVPTITIH